MEKKYNIIITEMKKRKKNHPLMNGKHTRSGLKNTFMPLQVKPSLSVEVPQNSFSFSLTLVFGLWKGMQKLFL